MPKRILPVGQLVRVLVEPSPDARPAVRSGMIGLILAAYETYRWRPTPGVRWYAVQFSTLDPRWDKWMLSDDEIEPVD